MTGIVKTLLEATKEDYEELSKQIDARAVELEALREAQKLIGIRLGIVERKQHGGPRTRKAFSPADSSGSTESSDTEQDDDDTPQPPAGTTKTEHYRKICQQYIQANGPTTLMDLARKTGIPSGSIGGVVNHPMFVKTAIGYGLKENHR